MNIIDRIAHSQEHSFIAFRQNGVLVAALIGLSLLTVRIFPLIVA